MTAACTRQCASGGSASALYPRRVRRRGRGRRHNSDRPNVGRREEDRRVHRCGISGCRATATAAEDLSPPMELGALCLTLVAIVLWAGISTRAAVISTPIFFVAIGLVLAEGFHLFDVETDSHQVKIIAEVTL